MKHPIKQYTGKYSCVAVSSVFGCTTKQLIEHIEARFRDGMTWGNMGSHWHLDHIKPLSLFNLTDANQTKEAGHYTNVQPLLVRENLSKGDKWQP